MNLLSTTQINQVKNAIKSVRQTVCDRTVYYYKFDPVTTEKDPLYDESRNKAYYPVIALNTRVSNKQPTELTIKEGGYDFDYDVKLIFTREHLIEKGLDILTDLDEYESAHELFLKDKFVVDAKELHIVKIIPSGQFDGVYQLFKVFGKFRSQDTDITQITGAWLSIEQVTTSTGDGIKPSVMLDADGTVRVIWIDDRTGTKNGYEDRRRNAAWDGNVALTNVSGQVLEITGFIDTDDNLHIVWVELNGVNNLIKYFKFDQANPTVTEIKSSSSAITNIEILQTENKTIHILWQESNSIYHQYQELDDEWSAATLSFTLAGININPSVGYIENDLVLVWENVYLGNSNIYYIYYTDGSWLSANPLTISNTAHGPRIDIPDNGYLYVVYGDTKTGNSQVYLKKYTGSWSDEERLTFETNDLTNLYIGVSEDGKTIIIYQKDSDIYAIEYLDGSVSDPVMVSGGYGSALNSHLYVDSQGIPYVVWCDNQPGNYEIFYRMQRR